MNIMNEKLTRVADLVAPSALDALRQIWSGKPVTADCLAANAEQIVEGVAKLNEFAVSCGLNDLGNYKRFKAELRGELRMLSSNIRLQKRELKRIFRDPVLSKKFGVLSDANNELDMLRAAYRGALDFRHWGKRWSAGVFGPRFRSPTSAPAIGSN